jgi:hypothetical protein
MTQKNSSDLETVFREETAMLARYAGLNLLPEHFEQLCGAWKHVQQMTARIPRERQRLDQPAHTFVNLTIGIDD